MNLKNSKYNFVLADGSSYNDENPVFKLDDNGNKIQRHEVGYKVKTDPTFDTAAIAAATESAEADYKLGKADCSDVVTAAFEVGKDQKGNNLNTGDAGIEFDLPVNKHENIKKGNKIGYEINLDPNKR